MPIGLPGSDRQCDHWARRGWVRPSVDPGVGRSGRRLYAASDVVRLDLLRHLAEAKVNTAVAGPMVARLSVPEDDVRILWGRLEAKRGSSSCLLMPPLGTSRREAGGWSTTRHEPALGSMS